MMMLEKLMKCRIGGVDVVMLIDSGSKHNLIDDTTWKLMKIRDVRISNERLYFLNFFFMNS